MDFVAVLDQVIALLRQRGSLTYRTLKRQFKLDDAALEDLKEELIYGQRLAVDEDKRVLVWIGDAAAPTPLASGPAPALDTIQAHCHRGLGTLYAATGQREPTRTTLSTAIALYRDMDMTFWLPQTKAALAQVG